jgi:hypothetical protein
MADHARTAIAISLIAMTARFSRAQASASGAADSLTQDKAGIEKLHKQDFAATQSGDPDALAELWSEDAVRLESSACAAFGASKLLV